MHRSHQAVRRPWLRVLTQIGLCAVTTALVTLPKLGQAAVPIATTNGKTQVSLDATVEGFIAYDANKPRDRAIPGRLFDPRHGELALSSVMVALEAETQRTHGRIALWRGWTPRIVYSGEPPSVIDWSLLQEAWGAVKATENLTLAGGLFGSPIGLESVFARDNWCWSSSHLNLAMPFYHTGLRAQYKPYDKTTLEAGLYSGWTQNVASNIPSTFIVRAFGEQRWGTWQLLVSGAPTRPALNMSGVGDVRGWLADGFITLKANSMWEFAAQVQAGAETWTTDDEGKMANWAAGTVYARLSAGPAWKVTARAEVFWQGGELEVRQGQQLGRLWWPVDTLSAATLSLQWRPIREVMVRLDARTDMASSPMFNAHDGELRDVRPTISLGLVWTL
ncbi:MAG: outer membrane beta-barrel protein [Myxococcales bacterium]|nr:outer membrane beta-barrel protein [Myxococcales bacterium]